MKKNRVGSDDVVNPDLDLCLPFLFGVILNFLRFIYDKLLNRKDIVSIYT